MKNKKKLVREVIGVIATALGCALLWLYVEHPVGLIGIVLIIAGIFLALKETIEES
jgi:predicted cobalt transporter CbtA